MCSQLDEHQHPLLPALLQLFHTLLVSLCYPNFTLLSQYWLHDSTHLSSPTPLHSTPFNTPDTFHCGLHSSLPLYSTGTFRTYFMLLQFHFANPRVPSTGFNSLYPLHKHLYYTQYSLMHLASFTAGSALVYHSTLQVSSVAISCILNSILLIYAFPALASVPTRHHPLHATLSTAASTLHCRLRSSIFCSYSCSLNYTLLILGSQLWLPYPTNQQ